MSNIGNKYFQINTCFLNNISLR